MGALGLPDRQPVHRRGQADPGRPEPPDAGHARRVQGREAVAELPERRSACGPAGDRRLHGPEHHHQRHGDRQPDLAAEGHSVGSGARHHHADQGSGHAQERQCRSDRAAGRACGQGETAARVPAADQRPGAAADRDVPAQLPEGRCDQGADFGQGRQVPVQARHRGRRCPNQHPVRAGYRRPAGGSAPADPPDRRHRAAGRHRKPHCHRRRQVRSPAGRALRHADRIHAEPTLCRRRRRNASIRSR